MKKSPATRFILFLWVPLFVQCGYQLKRNEVSVEALVKRSDIQEVKLFIPIPDNRTLRGGVEVYLARYLRENLALVDSINIVSSEKDADLLLLGTIYKMDLKSVGGGIRGSQDSEAAGGLSRGQRMASDFELTLGASFSMVQKLGSQKGLPKRTLWNQNYEKGITFPASRRYTQLGDSLDGASSSAPHINSSRERLFSEVLADQLSKSVIDQVLSDF